MHRSPKSKAPSALSVLYLGEQRAEWLCPDGTGGMSFGQAHVAGSAPQDWVSAACQAAQDAGGAPGPCVLMLGAGLVAQGSVQVPPLKRREQADVLCRRAARLLDVEADEVLFHAQETGSSEEPEEGAAAEHLWLVSSMPRELLRGLGIALRAEGFRVRRTTTSEFAACNRGEAAAAESCAKVRADAPGDAEQQAVLVALIESEQSTVTLVHEGRIVNREVYSGNFHERADLGPSLIQDIRSRAAYWRRVSRGSDVGTVLLLGLAAEHGARMQESVQLALPGIDVRSLPVGGGPRGGRSELLRCALVSGTFSADLTMKLPPRPARLMMASTALLLLFLLPAAWFSYNNLRILRDLEHDTVQLERETGNYGEVELERVRAEEGLLRLERELDRLAAGKRLGIDLPKMLETSLVAFDADAALLSLALTSGAGGALNLSARGTAASAPTESTAALGRIERSLEGSELFDSIEILPPPSLPNGRSENNGFVFSVEALQLPVGSEGGWGGDMDQEG